MKAHAKSVPASIKVGVFCMLASALVSTAPATRAAGPQAGEPLAAGTESSRASADTPRNIILLIGDGMGFGQVEAASLYLYGESRRLPFESWPVALAMSTYPAGGGYDPEATWKEFRHRKKGATDSAAAATALSTGVKTTNGFLGLDPSRGKLQHFAEWCEDRDLATGLVTSVEWSHATPAGFCAHVDDRDDYVEIARQMILESRLDVLMGCGHPDYDADGRPGGEGRDYGYVGGKSLWSGLAGGATKLDPDGDGNADRSVADADGDGRPDPWHMVQTPAEFEALAEGPTASRVLGVARVAHTLQEERTGDCGAAPFTDSLLTGVPTLEVMTRAALNVLDGDPDGFFLMVEGGAIDWASHGNCSGRMIEEMDGFIAAIEAVAGWVERQSGWDETLVIVTADHETGYLCGPGSGPPDRWLPLENRGRGALPGMIWLSDHHTNSLVPFYARGAGCEALAKAADESDPERGPYLDNTEIAGAIESLFQQGILRRE